MNTEKVIYETGATSHAVNDLILFTDTTRELAEKRDKAYKKMATQNERFNRPSSFVSLEMHYRHLFYDLMLTAMREYKRTFPNHEDHKHITGDKIVNDTPGTWTEKEDYEYINLYLNGFEDWKQENGYK